MVKYFPPGQDFTFDKSFGFTGSAQGRHDARDHMGEADDDAYGDGSYVERARGGGVRGERFEGDNANNLPLKGGGRVRRAKGGPVDPYEDHPVASPPDRVAKSLANNEPAFDRPPTDRNHLNLREREMNDPQYHGGGKARRGFQIGGAAVPTGGIAAPTSRPPNATPQPGMGALGRATITMPVADAARAASGMVQAGRAIGAGHGAARAPMPVVAPGAATALGAARPPVGGALPGMAKGGKVRHKGFHPGGEKGKLHRELGIPEDQKIPADRLASAAHSNNPEVRRDAIRAETMKRWTK